MRQFKRYPLICVVGALSLLLSACASAVTVEPNETTSTVTTTTTFVSQEQNGDETTEITTETTVIVDNTTTTANSIVTTSTISKKTDKTISSVFTNNIVTTNTDNTPTLNSADKTTKSSTISTTATTTKAPVSGPVESTSHSMLQTYIMSGSGNQASYTSYRQFAASVGYYPNGDLTQDPIDTMFDTFIFLGSPSFHSDSAANGGLRLMRKKDLEYFYDCEFNRSANLGALNRAVGELKEKLNKPNYKVNVFLPYVYAHPDLAAFGEVDGENLDLRIEENRFAAMKWQIDEQIRRFEEKGYEHIQILGFFLMTEDVPVDTDPFEQKLNRMAKYVNEYAASLGYESLVNPYNSYPTNYHRWEEVSFSRATMQINHFPKTINESTGEVGTQMNSHGIEQIQSAAERTAEHGLGITLEWSCISGGVRYPGTDFDGVMYFKRYLEGGVKYGYMNRPFNNYQLDGGANSIYNDCLKSDDPYTRSMYDELYKFIKGTLTVEDIRWYDDFS